MRTEHERARRFGLRPRPGMAAALLLAAAMLGWSERAVAVPLVLAFDEVVPWKTREGDVYGGAYTEIVRELARRVGAVLRIEPCPLKRCIRMVEEAKADIVIGLKDTPERRQFIYFLRTPYRDHTSDKVFYVLRKNGAVINSYGDLKSLRIGVKLGAQYFAAFDDDASLHKDASKDVAINFRKLALGRLDAVVVPEDQGEALLGRLSLRGLIGKAAFRSADASARSVGIATGSPYFAQREAFEQAMAAMVRDGTVRQIIRRHYYEAWKVPLDSVQIR